MHTKGIIGLAVTVLLCLPSFVGAAALLANLFLQRPIPDWGAASSVLVATVVFLGWPLVAVAAVVVAIFGLSHRVSQRVMIAEYFTVIFGVLATVAVTSHFGM
jgi:small-conductance mechanosensitive channel